MISEQAIVVAIEGNETWIETQRKSTCGSCAANSACGTSVLSKVLGKRMSNMKAINKIGARVGDRVMVSLDESALLKGAFMVYMLPLLLMFLFSFFGVFISDTFFADKSEIVVIIFAIIGFVSGLTMVKRYSLSISSKKEYQPVIVKKLPVNLI